MRRNEASTVVRLGSLSLEGLRAGAAVCLAAPAIVQFVEVLPSRKKPICMQQHEQA